MDNKTSLKIGPSWGAKIHQRCFVQSSVKARNNAKQHRRDAEFSARDDVLLTTKYLSLQPPEGVTIKLYFKHTVPLKVIWRYISCGLEARATTIKFYIHDALALHFTLASPNQQPLNQHVSKTIKTSFQKILSWVTNLALPYAMLKQYATW